MKLADLLPRCEDLSLKGDSGIRVRGITHDSRRVGREMIFAALPGEHHHGSSFVNEAISRGAAAILSDLPRPDGLGIPWLKSPRPREHMAEIAWILSGGAPDRLLKIGITGTNGKSTVSDIIAKMLNQSGRPCTLLGTLGAILPSGERIPGQRTTPEATDLAGVFLRSVREGAEAISMEVSSHALDQHRVHGLTFDLCVFTNLSRDHLDYHRDMESYFQSKERLFSGHCAQGGIGIIPAEDPWGKKLLETTKGRVISWGESRGDVFTEDLRMDLEGSTFLLNLGGNKIRARISLIGRHNLHNALAAAAAGLALKLSPEEIARGLASAKNLPGRMELVASDPCPVYVDYAHTPDALSAVLDSLQSLCTGKIVVVFGAGGDRDRGKRPLMGEAVSREGVHAVLTSDNPRGEDPSDIAADVEQGLSKGAGTWEKVLDRRDAIARALEIGQQASVVLVAGKGHEEEQVIGEKRLPFSDRKVIRELLDRTGVS